MKLQEELEKTIRSACFKLLYNENKHSYEEVVSSFIRKTEEIMGLKLMGIYAYCEWCQKYKHVLSSHDQQFLYSDIIEELSEKIPLFKSNELNHDILTEDIIFETYPDQMVMNVIKLNPYQEKIIYLLIMCDESSQLTKDLIEMIQREVSQFLFIIERHFDETKLSKRNAFLLSITSSFNTSMSDEDVLKLISDSLYELYPGFQHHILLSYDHKSNNDLPILLMKYSDTVTQEMSIKAFTTGEIQIERGLDADYAYIYAPLTGNQGVYGIIQIAMPIKKYFPKEEVDFLKKVSNIAGRAMESTMLHKNASLMIADLKLMNSAIHEFNSNLKLVDLISVIKSKIQSICAPMEIGFIFMNENSVIKHDILDGSSSFFKTEEGILFTDALVKQMEKDVEPVFSGDYTNICAKSNYKSVMSIPMTHANRYFGFILILHKKEAYFSFDNFRLIQSLIHHSTLAFSNTLLNIKLETLAITDYLTKLHSRRYLDEKLQHHMELGDKGTMILFDIDDFKKVNDTYGHSVGDEVLIQIADIIKENIAVTDIAARWGGEEFAIFMPNRSLTKGVALAEVLKLEVKEKTNPSVSFSCGVTSWHGGQFDSIETIFSRADKALYLAKNSGKNCVKTVKRIS